MISKPKTNGNAERFRYTTPHCRHAPQAPRCPEGREAACVFLLRDNYRLTDLPFIQTWWYVTVYTKVVCHRGLVAVGPIFLMLTCGASPTRQDPNIMQPFDMLLCQVCVSSVGAVDGPGLRAPPVLRRYLLQEPRPASEIVHMARSASVDRRDSRRHVRRRRSRYLRCMASRITNFAGYSATDHSSEAKCGPLSGPAY